MRDIGLPLNMSYGCKSSGTYTNNMITALVSFGYTDNMVIKEYKLSTLMSELDNNRPVVMSGYKNVNYTNYLFFNVPHYKDGHAWVCDGYREDIEKYINNPGTRYEYEKEVTTIFLHMNWGWNGQNDGWYTAYSPYNLVGINSNEYSHKLEMIVNIKP
ncbi:C10 family peptidase [Capnocytophaga stomatis]|uniref:C10 family peptidase n=1 Tax=Capnocytophaga stomatis TaxID=1848904 RepID=A0ABW8QB27_9FLAO|nr:C10 family peptidase [Capnocytophaga stomatis]GIJ93548.1 hypothetical protein CAPN002_07660 [Capnocytophaga stomatis]